MTDMTIARKEETRWCLHCTTERTITWLCVDSVPCEPPPKNCPVCGVLLMHVLRGATIPVSPEYLVVWDEQRISVKSSGRLVG